MFLTIDTSDVTTVALVEGTQLIASRTSTSSTHHVENIVPLIQELCDEAEVTGGVSGLVDVGLEAVCVGTGPAPFTGLRAGLMSAAVFADTLGVSVYGVSSLDVLARFALDRLDPASHVLAVSDARRKELYWGHYEAQGADDVALHGRLEVGPAADLLSDLAQYRDQKTLVTFISQIPTHSQEALAGLTVGPLAEMDPVVMSRIVRARLARGDKDALGTAPLYLRRPDIHGQAPQRM